MLEPGVAGPRAAARRRSARRLAVRFPEGRRRPSVPVVILTLSANG